MIETIAKPQETDQKVLMREAVIIYLSQDGKVAVISKIQGKSETLGILLTAVSIVSMWPEEPKSNIVKPGTQETAIINNSKEPN